MGAEDMNNIERGSSAEYKILHPTENAHSF